MGRLLPMILALLTPLLLAATPSTPLTSRLGAAFTLQIPLPEGFTVAGYPDLHPFALRAPPEVVEGKLVLELLPLRPGRHLFPPLPLVNAGNRSRQTAAVAIVVTAPEAPAALQPLKEFPLSTDTTSADRHWPLFLALALLLPAAACVWLCRRRKPELRKLCRLDALAQRFAGRSDRDDQRWQAFKANLYRLRFAPLVARDEQIAILEEQFEALCREGAA